MNRGIQPVLDAIEFDGCPFCGQQPGIIPVNGPDEIVLDCGQVIDAEAWVDEQYESG